MSDEKPKLGPTGYFPEGKLNDDDDGEIVFSIGTKDGRVVMEFGTSTKWVAMGPGQALVLADALKTKALELIRQGN